MDQYPNGGNNHQYTQGYQTTGSRQTSLSQAQRQARLRRKHEILRRRHRRKQLLAAFLVILIIIGLLFAIKALTKDDAPAKEQLDMADFEIDEETEEAMYTGGPIVNISFVGDVTCSAAQVADVLHGDGTYDFSEPFAPIAEFIEYSDYAVANFETNIVSGQSYGMEPYYNAPIQLAGMLRRLGFRLVSTANTYALNNGIEGIISTKQNLMDSQLKVVGTYTSQEDRDQNSGCYIRNLHKIKFAFLSYTKGTDSVRMPEGCEYALNTLYEDYADYWTELNEAQIKADIQYAKDAGAEVIVCLLHWGSEYGRSVSDSQKEIKDMLLQSGVDVIIGTHSHLVNEMGFEEVTLADGTVKNCFVAYGLGDFYTDPEQDSAKESVILNLEFERNDEGVVSITDANYYPIYQNITVDEDGQKHFEIQDLYGTIAEIHRKDTMSSAEAEHFNTLLAALETIHTYAPEELDGGPKGEDLRVVEKALEDGKISWEQIKILKNEEQAAIDAANSTPTPIPSIPVEDAEE